MTGAFSSPLLNQPTALVRTKKVLDAEGRPVRSRLLLKIESNLSRDFKGWCIWLERTKDHKDWSRQFVQILSKRNTPNIYVRKRGLIVGEVREMRVIEWLGQANDVVYSTRMVEGVRRTYFICYSPRTESNLSITSSTESRSPFAGVPVSIVGPGSAASAPAAPGWFCVVDIVRRAEKRVQRRYGVIAMTDDLPPVRPLAGSTEAKASCTVYLWSKSSLSIPACFLFLPLTSHVSSQEPRSRDFPPGLCGDYTPHDSSKSKSIPQLSLSSSPPESNLHPSSLPLFCLPRNVACTWFCGRGICAARFGMSSWLFLPKAKAKGKSVATSEENKKFLGSQLIGWYIFVNVLWLVEKKMWNANYSASMETRNWNWWNVTVVGFKPVPFDDPAYSRFQKEKILNTTCNAAWKCSISQ